MTSTANDASVLTIRQKLKVFGSANLSEAELLAVAMGKTKPGASQFAKMLENVGGLGALAAKTPHELKTVSGFTESSADRIAAIVELSRRLGRIELKWGSCLRQPSDAASFARAELKGSTQENFVVLGLDSRQRIRLVRTVGIGSLAQVDVHPRELFRPLIRAGIHAVILVHNHPSGDPEPSEADVELTHRMAEVGRLVGIPVLDHLVVTDSDFCSLAALGLLSSP
jgi:DNA repair protein RadC